MCVLAFIALALFPFVTSTKGRMKRDHRAGTFSTLRKENLFFLYRRNMPIKEKCNKTGRLLKFVRMRNDEMALSMFFLRLFLTWLLNFYEATNSRARVPAFIGPHSINWTTRWKMFGLWPLKHLSPSLSLVSISPSVSMASWIKINLLPLTAFSPHIVVGDVKKEFVSSAS